MNRSTNARAAILAIFILSGAAGLVYEVVWSRQLVLVFGNTTQAVSTILTGFFGGMAVGAWFGGRLADRVRRPLRLYGFLELALAVVVLLTPLTFRFLHEVYRGTYPSLVDSPGALALVRFALAIAALAPATVLMGATLPTLTRYFSRDASRDLSAAFGRLYAANTVGAIVGTALAGLVLIELLGLSGALAVGAVGSTTAGLVALLLDRRLERAPQVDSQAGLGASEPLPTEGATPAAVGRPWLALGLAVAFISGFTSLAYQVTWNRLVAAGTGNSTYVFTVILVFFLLGLAIGAVVFNTYRSRIRSVLVLVAFGQVAIALLVVGGMLGVIARHPAAPLTADASVRDLVAFFLATAFVVLPPTIVMGLTFPAASALVAGPDGRVATRSGLLLAVNTTGAICGTFIVPFFVIPTIGSPATVGLVALINAGAGIALALIARDRAGRPVWSTVAAGGVVLAVVVAALGRGGFTDPTAALVRDSGGTVYETAEDEIAPVVSGEVYGYPQLWVAGTSMTFLTIDTKLMPLLPLMARPNADRALIIAFGMGSSFRTSILAGFHTDAVELVPSVPRMFGHYFDDAAAVMADPNAKVIAADGRNHVELTDQTYDFVVVDPPPPIESSGVSVISSYDFYVATKARLNPGGIMLQWIPYGQSVDEFRAHVRSFDAAFEHVVVAFGPDDSGLYMLGSTESITFSDEAIRAALARPGIVADLASAYPSASTIDEWAALIPQLVWITDAQVAAFAGSGPIITDDRPYPEYFLLRRLFGPPSPPVTHDRLLALTGGSTSATP